MVKSAMAKFLRVFLVLLAAFLVAPACNSKINWPEMAKCSPGVSDLVGTVTEILLGDSDWVEALDNLARTHGAETVACVVDRLRADWSAPGRAMTPERARALNRANEYLERAGTKFE